MLRHNLRRQVRFVERLDKGTWRRQFFFSWGRRKSRQQNRESFNSQLYTMAGKKTANNKILLDRDTVNGNMYFC